MATGAVPLPPRVSQRCGETTGIHLHPVQVRPLCFCSSLVPRPFPCQVFDRLQYTKERPGLYVPILELRNVLEKLDFTFSKLYRL